MCTLIDSILCCQDRHKHFKCLSLSGHLVYNILIKPETFHVCWWQLSIYLSHLQRCVTVRLSRPCSPGISSL